jgi:lipopolysaccharide export system permease protein
MITDSRLMRILDRYVLAKFLLPFIYCFFGFIAIWFIFDLSDNLQDFLSGKASFGMLLTYYYSQVPQIILISLPIGMLLALLYSLTAMSRSNEIISMLGAGVSVSRILVPLYLVGLVLVALCTWCNYESAPHAEMVKKQILDEIKRGRKTEPGITGHLYRNREDNRTWFMRRILPNKNVMRDLQILAQDKDGNIVEEWLAQSAEYNSETKEWVLLIARHIVQTPDGDIVSNEMKEQITIPGWRETPWRIASSIWNSEYLSVDELRDYLSYNADQPANLLAPYRTHLEYRWALPWGCFIVVLLAAPMGIVFSRRGILGGVATAIGLFFCMFFMSMFFVALGKGNRVPPMVAAWTPIVVFFIIGVWLLWYRSTNRDIPKFKLPWTS